MAKPVHAFHPNGDVRRTACCRNTELVSVTGGRPTDPAVTCALCKRKVAAWKPLGIWPKNADGSKSNWGAP